MAGEKRLQAFIVKTFKNMGVLTFKFDSPGRPGVPDLLCVPPGKPVFFIEVKNPNGRGRLSPKQVHIINLIREQGTAVYVISSKSELTQLIEREGL